MAMSFEEAQRITNQKLAKQRKGYLAENAYRQSDENRERIKNRLISIAEATTPLGDVQTGIDAKTAYDEGRYLDAAGNAAMIGLGYTPLGPLARPLGRLAKRVNRDKDMLIPALKDKDYRELVKRETIMGKAPLAPKSIGSASNDPLKELTERRAKEMKQATKDYGERMGAMIHSTDYDGPLDVNNFEFRAPNIAGKSNELGIFTHSPTDPTNYGRRKFAVLYKDKPGNYVAGKQDTESGVSEVFIPKRAVEDIYELK